ncbi:MAG: hypothetical protein RIS29_1888 [Bacteroidota bacterium]|jgi:hypothetical protein
MFLNCEFKNIFKYVDKTIYKNESHSYTLVFSFRIYNLKNT